jgi:hypothetical protein
MPVSKPVAVLLLLLVVVPGCARSGGGSPPGDVTVVVHRTGGFAGVDDTVIVEPDGRWRSTSRRGSPHAGRLTDAQRDRLRTLATDPRLLKEADSTPGPSRCADTFNYTVTVGATRVAYIACPTGEPPPEVAGSIVELVMDLLRPM